MNARLSPRLLAPSARDGGAHGQAAASIAAALFAAGWCVWGAALAAPAGAASAPQVYQAERAACNAGRSTEDRAACLREAGAALQEARQGRLNGPVEDQATLERNRLARCDRHQGAERDDCLRMLQGGGTSSGSVAGGGILRELTTVVPAGGN